MNNYQTIERSGIFIYLMEILNESIENSGVHMNSDEISRFNSIKNPHKKKEFSTTRKLKYLLFGNESIQYNESGSPFITSKNIHLGISHAKDIVCIATAPYRFGIDLEYIDSKAKRVAHKFCNHEEQKIFDIHSNFDMSLLWSFKESLYKVSDRKELIFLDDIFVEKINHEFIGNIRCKKGFEKYRLHFEVHNMLILTFTANEFIQ